MGCSNFQCGNVVSGAMLFNNIMSLPPERRHSSIFDVPQSTGQRRFDNDTDTNTELFTSPTLALLLCTKSTRPQSNAAHVCA